MTRKLHRAKRPWRWAIWALSVLPARAQSTAPIGELFASEPGAPAAARPAGAGMRVVSGSKLTAGIAPATLKLARGGQVRICPKSSMNINASTQGLMLAMSTGAMEINYRLAKSSGDLIVTPDFTIRLAGPAAYHFALGVNSQGDTCVKPLPGNGAGILFSESFGADVYGVAANESAVFMGGKLSGRTALSGNCGCPPGPPSPALNAEAEPDSNLTRESKGSPAGIARASPGGDKPQGSSPPLEVNAPFVFSASAAGGARPNAVARIEFSSLPNIFFAQEEAAPVVLVEKPAEVSIKREVKAKAGPGKEPKKRKKSFLGRIKGFFGSLFRR